MFKRAEHEERRVREYFESQSRRDKDNVIHLEKVATERIRSRRLDAWDVRAESGRWWVITNPMNLYRQDDFPSLDFLMSFHIGLMERVFARDELAAPDEQQRRLAAAWRRWRQAAEALEAADEAEEFQAVGMRCRECLLEFTRAAADPRLVPAGQDVPKRGDFVAWAEAIAQSVAPGESGKALRAYLRDTSKAVWQLLAWLTHATNAVRFDAELAVEATQTVMGAFGASLVRRERGMVDRCPNCRSYRLSSDYRPDLDIDPPYVTRCESCGWADHRSDA